MSRGLRSISVLLIILLLTACGKTTVPPVEEPEEQPEEIQVQVPEEQQELAVFEGTYRYLVPEEGDEGYVQITACSEFLLLEHFLCMEGSVYSFWAEEFWPNEDGFTDGEFTSVSGKSQTFSGMTSGDLYDTMPRNRVITLTEDGVVLNYDDSDAEYCVKDSAFSYHSSREQLRQALGEGTGKKDEALYGIWSWRNSREAVFLTFREDGSVSLLQKEEGEPAEVWEGVFSFEQGGKVSILAEKIGDGCYPYVRSWQWHVDADNMLWLTFEDDRQIIFLPAEKEPTRSIDGQISLSYVGSHYDMDGEYTDQYGTEYEYVYRLPQFFGDDADAMEVNRQIMEIYAPLIETELGAMVGKEFLSFTEVNWEGNIHEDVLYLHVYAKTWDWEEHNAYYYDTVEGRFLTTQEVLDRLLIDQGYFLEAVREGAEAAFLEIFSDIPEGYKEESGYYEMKEWTVSEEAVNLQVPIFVDRFGSIAVYARIGSMAGSGIIWEVLRPFDGAVG